MNADIILKVIMKKLKVNKKIRIKKNLKYKMFKILKIKMEVKNQIYVLFFEKTLSVNIFRLI